VFNTQSLNRQFKYNLVVDFLFHILFLLGNAHFIKNIFLWENLFGNKLSHQNFVLVLQDISSHENSLQLNLVLTFFYSHFVFIIDKIIHLIKMCNEFDSLVLFFSSTIFISYSTIFVVEDIRFMYTELVSYNPKSFFCYFGEGASRPIQTLWTKIQTHFEHKIYNFFMGEHGETSDTFLVRV